MVGRRSLTSWWLAAASAAACAVGASAQGSSEPVRSPARSQGVVTPDTPIFAGQNQEPGPAPVEPAEPDEPDSSAGSSQATGQTAPEGPGPARGRSPRTYAQFLREARTDEGIFKVHRIDDAVFFELPKQELGKDFLWVSQIKRTTLGAGYGGQAVADRVVRWEQHDDRIYLKLVEFDMVADPDKPIAQAVRDANVPTIVRGFNVLLANPDGDPVINVTSLLTGDVPEFSPRQRLGARGLDQSRSYLEKVVAFPENINVQVTQTYTPGAGEAASRGRGGLRGSGGTVVMFHSLIKLPEEPMMPRLADARVGFFTTSMYDFGRDENKAVERTYITRYRLEKEDPAADVSDPVKPIVYYVDPATPAKLVPWVIKGVEEWQPAFEAAGFRNAIVAREAPSKEEDPDWDPEDVRYSVIRWLPSTTENASGPHVHDPRSGEILEADVQMFHNVQNLAAMWYFTQVGALDPRAQKLPLPDDLTGRLVQFLVAHEVGHTLGFRHNMKASSLYTIDQIRDKEWVRVNGHTPSIMDYARFNYVAQPEDGLAVEDLVPRVGPYDQFAVRWGYTPIAGARTPDEERPVVDEWARMQDTNAHLRFTTDGETEGNPYPFDPGQETEAVGDIDATRATELGLKNLQRVAELLVPATAQSAQPYDSLREVYGRLVSQWRVELGHVVNVVGGVDSRELYVGQEGHRFTPIAKARQAAAVAFLLENAFETPSFLVDPDVLRRIEPTGAVARIRTAQNSLMNALLQSSRLSRMVEAAVIDTGTYTPLQFLTDLRRGVWKELASPGRPIDLFRRNVQRVYLDTIDNRLNGSAAASDEIRALLRGELRVIDRQIAAALSAVTDTATRRHLEDVRESISATLDPRVVRESAAALGLPSVVVAADGDQAPEALQSSERYDYERDPFLTASDGCWLTPEIR